MSSVDPASPPEGPAREPASASPWERLGSSEDRRLALLSVTLGAGLIWLALPPDAQNDLSLPGSFIAATFWVLVTSAAFAAVAPARALPFVQGFALAGISLVSSINVSLTTTQTIATLAMWAGSALLTWKLPLKKKPLRQAMVVVVTVGMIATARVLTYHQGIILLQFLFASEILADRDDRSLLDCQRATSIAVTNMPPEELMASTRAISSIWIGAALVAGGFVMLRLLGLVAGCGSARYTMCAQGYELAASDAIWLHPRPGSLAWTVIRHAMFILNDGLYFFMCAGALRFLGVPVSMPMGNLLRARNLFQYWKMTNRWRYELLSRVYVDNFFVFDSGLFGTLSIIAVFLISGLHHAAGEIGTSGPLGVALLRSLTTWVVGGVLCSITFQWIMFKMRRRVRASVQGTPVRQPGPRWTAIVGALCFLSIFAVQGLTMSWDEVYAHTKPFELWTADAPDGHDVAVEPASARLAGGKTDASPALAAHANLAFAAWKSRKDPTVLLSRSIDGGDHFGPPGLVPGALTDASPALAMLGADVVAAWKVTESDSIHWSRLRGNAWGAPETLVGARTSSAPALGALDDTLYVAWENAENHRVMWTRIGAGGTFERPEPMGQTKTRGAPSLGEHGGVLYAAWPGGEPEDADADAVLWSSLDVARRWQPGQRVPGVMARFAPTLASRGPRMYLLWTGTELDSRIHWASFSKGALGPEVQTRISTCDRPAAALGPGSLIVASRGTEGTRCDDRSDFGGDWDRVSVYVTHIDVSRRALIPLRDPAPAEDTGL